MVRNLSCIALVFLAFAWPASAAPLLVEIEPNAIVELKNGELPQLAIEVRGVAEGATVELAVVGACGDAGKPAAPGAECPAKIPEWTSEPANRKRKTG